MQLKSPLDFRYDGGTGIGSRIGNCTSVLAHVAESDLANGELWFREACNVSSAPCATHARVTTGAPTAAAPNTGGGAGAARSRRAATGCCASRVAAACQSITHWGGRRALSEALLVELPGVIQLVGPTIRRHAAAVEGNVLSPVARYN